MGDRIHFGDLVDIDVVGSLDFDWRGGLTPEGFLDGPPRVANPIFALCRTEQEVAALVRSEYSKILRTPEIVVRIVDRSNRSLAYVNGAVENPQRFQLRRQIKLAEIIVLAGGITDGASGEIAIFRPASANCTEPSAGNSEAAATPKRFSVKIADVLKGVPGSDPTVLAGDIVTVVQAPPVFVAIGGVIRARLDLTPELTLSRAAAAAGVGPKGSKDQKVRIFRRSAGNMPLEFDLARIWAGSDPDQKLEGFDVIEVAAKNQPAGRFVPFPEQDRSEISSLSRLPLRIVD